MADYYPLISRAVAGLEKNNGENRRALYERARAALLAQLRGVTPPLNEFGHHPRAPRARGIDPQGRGRIGASVRRSIAPVPGGQIPLDRAALDRLPSIGGAAAGHHRPGRAGCSAAALRHSVVAAAAGGSVCILARLRAPFGNAFVVAEPAGFAAVGFDFRSAAAAGAATVAAALRRRAARLFRRRPQGCSRRPGTRHRGRRTPLRPAAIRPRRAPHVRSAGAARAHVRSGRAARTRDPRRFLRADAGAGIGARRLPFRYPPGTASAAAADR